MSDAEVILPFDARQIVDWDTEYAGRNEPGRRRVAGDGVDALRSIARPSAGLYESAVDLRHPLQLPRLQFRFERLTRSSFSFDSFRLIPAQRLLLDTNQPVRIGSRAMDLLTALVEQAGKILTKQELTKRVWPDVFVEEHNLKVQMSELRKVLGDRQAGRRYVLTVPGRGYAFVAKVTRQDEPGN